ncbi:MAG: hypothetical protein ABIE23_01425 [archaeon]
MDKKKTVKIIILFIITYTVLYFLPFITPLKQWEFTSLMQANYLFFLIPFPAFFFMYLIIDWVNEYFETNLAHNPVFPLLFVILCFAAFYVQIGWYYGNLAVLSSNSQTMVSAAVSLDPACSGSTQFLTVDSTHQVISICYWNNLIENAFLVFVFAGIAGWLSFMITEKWKFRGEASPEKSGSEKKE